MKTLKQKQSDNILIMGDLHLGVSKDNPWIEENIYNQLKYFTDYCKQNNIDTIIQCGDWFDQRKAITHRTLEFNREKIIPLFDGLKVFVVVGNHDAHFKNQILPNSPTEILRHYSNFTIINEPTSIEINKVQFDLIPWMCQDNQESIFEFIKNSNSDFCVGHFELTGFYFYKGLKSHGLSQDFLGKYKHVYSGHFHTISSNSNVLYVGTPYTITNNDSNDQRGVWEFNTKRILRTQNFVKFISNPDTYHYKLFLQDDSKIEFNDINKFVNKQVVLSVQNYSDKKELDKILTRFEEATNQFSYSISYDSLEQQDEIAENIEDSQKTIDLVKIEINKLEESQEQKDLLLSLFNKLYIEALTS